MICVDCDKVVKQTKVYAFNLNELKRKPPNNFCCMLPWYKENKLYLKT